MDTRIEGFLSLVSQYKEMVSYDMHFSNMHIVIEDGNMDDDHIDWCVNRGVSDEERAVAEWLKSMPVIVREAIWSVS